jgi:hypothetical protein
MGLLLDRRSFRCEFPFGLAMITSSRCGSDPERATANEGEIVLEEQLVFGSLPHLLRRDGRFWDDATESNHLILLVVPEAAVSATSDCAVTKGSFQHGHRSVQHSRSRNLTRGRLRAARHIVIMLQNVGRQSHVQRGFSVVFSSDFRADSGISALLP